MFVLVYLSMLVYWYSFQEFSLYYVQPQIAAVQSYQVPRVLAVRRRFGINDSPHNLKVTELSIGKSSEGLS